MNRELTMKNRTITMLMRNWGLPIAVFCSLTFLFAISAAAAEFVSVKKDEVNLRSGPGTDHQVLFQLPAGDPLQVFERQWEWINVRDYENDRGWIYEGLVSKAPHVIVTVQDGNIRSGPGTEHDKIGKVVKDVILEKKEQKGDWLKVSHPLLNGWIYKNLVWP